MYPELCKELKVAFDPIGAFVVATDAEEEEKLEVLINQCIERQIPYEIYKLEDSDHEMLTYYSLGNYISANQRSEHNSGGLAFINVALTSSGPVIKSYDLKEIDTMYKSSKY